MMRNSSGNWSLLDSTQAGNPTWIYIWVFYHKYKKKKRKVSAWDTQSVCCWIEFLTPTPWGGGQIVKRETDVIRVYTQTTSCLGNFCNYKMYFVPMTGITLITKWFAFSHAIPVPGLPPILSPFKFFHSSRSLSNILSAKRPSLIIPAGHTHVLFWNLCVINKLSPYIMSVCLHVYFPS